MLDDVHASIHISFTKTDFFETISELIFIALIGMQWVFLVQLRKVNTHK